jgi:hypothetical protein
MSLLHILHRLPLSQSHPASYEHYTKTLLIKNELLHLSMQHSLALNIGIVI